MDTAYMRDEHTPIETKVIAAAGTICLLVAVATLHRVPPASGYEISIYRAYPWYFWGCLVGTTLLGQLVVLRSAVVHRNEGRDWIIGGLLTVVPGFILLALPYIRGYPIYGRGDVLTHAGLIRDLPDFGILLNIYPPMHLLIQSLAAMTGMEVTAVMTLLPVVFGIVFFSAMVLIVAELFKERQRALLCLPVVLIPFAGSAHVTMVPFVLSVLLTPLVMFLLIKQKRTKAVPFRAMLLLAIVGVLVYHPLTAVFLLVLLGVYSGFNRVPSLHPEWTGLPNLTSFALVVFTAWYMKYTGIIVRFRNVIADFINPTAGESPLQARTETIERTSPEALDLLRAIIIQRGSDVLIFGLAAVFLAVVGLLWYRNNEQPGVYVALFGGIALLFGGVAAVFLTNDLIAGFGRPLLFGKLFAVLFVGALVHLLLQGATTPVEETTINAAFGVVLVVLILLSVFSMFASPLAFERNHQVTHAEVDGTEWLYENRNDELLIEERGIRQYRFYHLHYGTEEPSPSIRWGDASPPDHFNYTEHETLGASYDDPRYMVLPELARITYPERFPDYPEQWRFTASDFDQLENDRSVARVYDNGEFNSYRIQPEQPEE